MIPFAAKETPTVTGCVLCNRHGGPRQDFVDFPQYAMPKVLSRIMTVRLRIFGFQIGHLQLLLQSILRHFMQKHCVKDHKAKMMPPTLNL